MKKIGVIGCGHMGYAIIKSLVTKLRNEYDFTIYDRHLEKSKKIADEYLIEKSDNLFSITEKSDILFLCVQPANMLTLLKEMSIAIRPHQILISVAAGVTIEEIQSVFHVKQKIVRLMPNIATIIGQGMTAYTYTEELQIQDQEELKKLLDSFGESILLDESKFSMFTALCGSSPAFILMVADALVQFGIQNGLSEEQSKKMVTQTFSGTIEFARTSNSAIVDIVKSITTKGGTTEQGVNVLREYSLTNIMYEALEKTMEKAEKINRKES